MNRRQLGRSGISVNPIGLGGMPMSIQGRPESAQSIKVICLALDNGIDFIDTADVYCLDDDDIGHNERLIAKAIREWKGGTPVWVATKGGMARSKGEWTTHGEPQHLKKACEASLKALGTDCIDLYQLHVPDDHLPFSDSVGALSELKQEGKIRHVGLSNVSVAQIKEARGIVEIVSVQNKCNLYAREDLEEGVVDYCEKEGIAFLPYSPVGGFRKHKRTGQDPLLQEIADRNNMSPYQVALIWLLAKSPVMIPIPGASRPESARSSAGAMKCALSPEDITQIDRMRI
ncbi:MAG: aldo/keto reductase [Nitrospira sp.]|nr:aldo/keto reductase [Candidatus Manganitrophaceae bacterium]HIL34659.1 aldo/keto reductase [Candidatus Manganitrophaceae bacterium]